MGQLKEHLTEAEEHERLMVTEEEDEEWDRVEARMDVIGQNGNDGEHYDAVNNPRHYDLFPGQQAIDIIRAALTDEEFAGYCKGNALKYRLRAGEKGDVQQDVDKSNWYRDKLRYI